MDLRRLRYFVAVAEELHFGRAAERVHVVQSAISQQIRLLEEELGFPLFERTRRSVRLTVPGEIFLPEAREILRRTEQALARVRASAGGAVGRLSLGFVDNVLWSLLPPILQAFRQRYPLVELSLMPLDRSAQLEALRSGAIDIGLFPSPSPLQGIETAVLAAGPLKAALPERHRLAGRPRIALSALREEPFVLFPARMRSRILELILNGCASAGFNPRVAQEAEQLHTVLALVSGGLGVTIVPEWVARAQPMGVAYAELEDLTAGYEVLIGWNSGDGNPAVASFRTVALGDRTLGPPLTAPAPLPAGAR